MRLILRGDAGNGMAVNRLSVFKNGFHAPIIGSKECSIRPQQIYICLRWVEYSGVGSIVARVFCGGRREVGAERVWTDWCIGRGGHPGTLWKMHTWNNLNDAGLCQEGKHSLDWIFSSWIATSFVMTGSDCMSMFRISSVTVSRVYGYSSPHFASENRK